MVTRFQNSRSPISQYRQRSIMSRGAPQPGMMPKRNFLGPEYDDDIQRGPFEGEPPTPAPIPNFDPSEPPEITPLGRQAGPFDKGFKGMFGGQRPDNVTSKLDFGGNDTITAPSPTGARQGSNDRASQFYELMEKMRNRETPGLTAYRQALNEVPTSDQYRPNWLTRIGAGLAGFSAGMRDPTKGAETAMNINRSNYDNALAEYSNRLGTLKEQATMEEAANRSQMDAVHKAYQMGLDYDKLNLETTKANATIRQGDIRAGAAVTTANAAVARANTAAEALKRQGIISKVQQDGSLMVIDPVTHESTLIPGHAVEAYSAQSSRISANAAASNAATNRIDSGTRATDAQTRRGQLQLDQQFRPMDSMSRALAARAAAQRALDAPTSRASPGALESSSSQQAARDLAVEELLADPYWGDLIRQQNSNVPGWLGGGVEDDDAKDIEDAIQAKVNQILSRPKAKPGGQ